MLMGGSSGGRGQSQGREGGSDQETGGEGLGLERGDMGAYPGQETGRGQDQGKRVQGGMEVGVKEVGAGIDMGGRRDRDEQARNMEEQVQKAKEMGVEMQSISNQMQ